MKTKLVVLLVVGIVAMFVAGCEKDDIIIDENQNLIDDVLSDEDRPKPLGEYVPEDDQFFKENVLDYENGPETNFLKSGDAMYNLISNAVSVWSIPNYAFRCYDNYKWGYRHVRQPDGYSCSWTSYVICTGNIAAVCGRTYPVTVNQVYVVKNGCGGSKLITKLRDYANTVDRNIVKARTISLQKSTTDCLAVFKQMMLLLYEIDILDFDYLVGMTFRGLGYRPWGRWKKWWWELRLFFPSFFSFFLNAILIESSCFHERVKNKK